MITDITLKEFCEKHKGFQYTNKETGEAVAIDKDKILVIKNERRNS